MKNGISRYNKYAVMIIASFTTICSVINIMAYAQETSDIKSFSSPKLEMLIADAEQESNPRHAYNFPVGSVNPVVTKLFRMQKDFTQRCVKFLGQHEVMPANDRDAMECCAHAASVSADAAHSVGVVLLMWMSAYKGLDQCSNEDRSRIGMLISGEITDAKSSVSIYIKAVSNIDKCTKDVAIRKNARGLLAAMNSEIDQFNRLSPHLGRQPGSK